MRAPLTSIPGEKVSEIEPRIRLVAFNDIRLSTARRDLVKGLIPRAGLAVIWGPPKCGKSFWIFDLMLHVALGWEYRGRRVHQGPVVYCAFEGQFGIQARVEAFRQRSLPADPDPIPFYLEGLTLDLVQDHPDLIAAIRRQLSSDNPVAIVLDTLNRSIRGSESKDDDMAQYIAAADALRESFDCVVIIVHHCGVSGDRPRGHTSLTGAIDTQLKVTRDEADNIIVEVELAKDGPQGDKIVSRLECFEVGLDEDGGAIASCVVAPTESQPEPAKVTKLAAVPRAALQALNTLVCDEGQDAPRSDRVPKGVRGVTLEAWKTRLRHIGVLNAEGNPREQFRRINVTLQNARAIGVYEGFVWPVT
jgi:hypothetical protein